MTAVVLDDLSSLFGLMAEQRDTSTEGEKAQISSDAQRRDAEMRKRIDSMKKEASARAGKGFFGSMEKLISDVASNAIHLKPGRILTDTKQNFVDMGNSQKFWSDLSAGAALAAKVASVVISAATIITGPGAVGGVAFAAAIISLVAMAESELNVMEKCGMNEGAANGARIGIALVTTALGNGEAASRAASGAAQASQAATKAGEVAKQATTLTKVATATSQTAKVLEPTATAASQGAKAAAGVHEYNAENHRADGETHGHAKDRAQRDLDTHIQASIENMENVEKLLDLVQQTMAARTQTTLSLAAAIGGRA